MEIVELLKMFGLSLGMTIVLELTVAVFLGIRSKYGICLVLLVNVLTNPAAVLLACWGSFSFKHIGKIWIQFPIEVLVILAETLIYGIFSVDEKWNIRHPVLLAVLANGVSWMAGFVLQAI